MKPTSTILLASLSYQCHAESFYKDEQSMLQMPVERAMQMDSTDSGCACPGYFESECLANAFQGCIWTDDGNSNAPWCGCDPNFVPTPPLFTNQVPEPECSQEALEKCQGNVPCIDLREGENHHHLMWLNGDGTAHVEGEAHGIGAGDARTWTCQRTGNGVGLVDVWHCPGFYGGGAITITEDYADDFTAARANDHIDVCARGCSQGALQKCQGNIPCIDLREGDNHHHLMWLNGDGTAHVEGEAHGIGAGDARTWTCQRTGNGVGLVDVWHCPGFYGGGSITITEDYADDFTAARANDHIDVCVSE